MSLMSADIANADLLQMSAVCIIADVGSWLLSPMSAVIDDVGHYCLCRLLSLMSAEPALIAGVG
jgi:hypothetical protein